MYEMFLNFANYLHEAMGAELFYKEIDGVEDAAPIAVICPECGEIIYFSDWARSEETENWTCCPICGWHEEEEDNK